jgi:hypothetical protein
VSFNSAAGFGGGLAIFSPSHLDGDGEADNPVNIGLNSAGTDGGGLWVSGTANLQTALVSANSAADEGGGAFVADGATLVVTELSGCGIANLGLDEYCSEFRGNIAGPTGGAVHVAGGRFFARKTGFIGNSADGAAVAMGTGAAEIDFRSVVAFNNTQSDPDGDGLVTGQGTTSVILIAVTFANHTVPFLDTDDSASVVVRRVLTTTGALPLASPATGSCNQSSVPVSLPGVTVTGPQFQTVLPPKENSSHIPGPNNHARDRCAQLSGLPVDAHDKPVQNGAGVGSTTEWDIGGLEAPK